MLAQVDILGSTTPETPELDPSGELDSVRLLEDAWLASLPYPDVAVLTLTPQLEKQIKAGEVRQRRLKPRLNLLSLHG